MPIHDYDRALRAHRDAVSFVQRSGWPIFNWLKTGATNCLPWTRPSKASLRGIIQEAGVAEALQATSNMLGAALVMATLASAERKEEKQNDA